jgi:radical SAM superfamily enzyme YgiQ (UPF0313 family)
LKIALLSPAGAMHRYNGMFSKNLHYAPMTLTLLAALVPNKLDATVFCYDETAGAIPLDLDADIIGITCITGTSVRVYKYADYFRSRGITVILGGPHPSLAPEEAAQHADSVVIGLADKTWPQALEDFADNKLKKYYYASNIESPDCLAQRPHPRRDLLDKKRYITLNTVEATRGCHLNCSFCAYPKAFGHGLKTRPVTDVIEEIKQLPGRGPFGKLVVFPDVNLLSDLDYATDLCTAMIPLKKWWFGLSTSDVILDEELLILLERSGCKGLLIGFESINQSSQIEIRKGVNTVANYRQMMEGLHRHGIMVMGCFAFGADEEGPDVFEQTAQQVDAIKIDLPRYAIITPFPQTETYRKLEEQGRIIERDLALYDVEHCVFEPKQMSKTQLEQGTAWAWKASYSIGSIFKRLDWRKPKILLFSFIYLIVNIGYRKYAQEFEVYDSEVMSDNSDIPEPNADSNCQQKAIT